MNALETPAVVIVRPDGVLSSCNPQAKKMLGYDGTGRHCWDAVGSLKDAQGLPCKQGCVGRVFHGGVGTVSHGEFVHEGRRFHRTCLAADGEVVCVFTAKGSAKASTWERLTPREREVLDLVSEGMQTEEIAEVLHMSEATARSHVQNMRMKLGVSSRAALVARAFRLGLL